MKNPETLFMGQNLIHLPDVDSTNNFAANLIKQTKVIPGTVILADNQHQGRGQSGNIWEVMPGTNLTFTLILQPKIPAQDQFLVSKITCLALIDTLDLFEIKAKIKWPNDILVGKQKISGILIENVLKGKLTETSIVGIGLNVNQEFEGNMNAISIKEIKSKEIDKEEVLHRLLQQMEKWYLKFERGLQAEINSAYLNHLYGLNLSLEFSDSNSKFSGKITGVNKIGQLLIQLPSGETNKYNNKEVQFLLD